MPSEYEDYLEDKYADPLVLATLEYAMEREVNIECEAPMNERLHYQLSSYFIPTISSNIEFFYNIDIIAPLISISNNKQTACYGVGTGFSGGVDSFYTVLKHMNPKQEQFKLTHLLLANVGANSY